MVIEDGIKKLIEDNALSMSTCDKEGNPHSIAIAGCAVLEDKVIITNIHIFETITNLENNNKISLAVWHKDWKNVCVGFELRGVAENYTKGEWLEFVKKLPDNDGCDVKSAIVVTVNYIKKLLS
jgi:predicted pyridoxine 5'-phosphate oxidase superfamily flavin-nucleotide-binding protein